MNQDTSLFDDVDYRTLRPITEVHGLARYGDPPTSRGAAAMISGRTERLIVQTFTTTNRNRGMTDDELADWLPTVYAPTLKTARSRLSRAGVLADSGERRKSVRGVDMVVWKLA